ncbi:hypothetical protein ATM97_22905 [Nocardia sp. MH4]|uniref:hypothetical protein n=1 Tax=Nocardia sp. MH4 TaxID=1768677 RepID=UPI001C4FDD93|nr:hypothetical protein [Nocardia sp. MH4]MBW0272940.1 hypothetical protein [Nocardia sp. MH4]
MGDICIDPAAATAAGTAISTNSSESRNRVETQFDEIDPAAAANDGWTTGPALVDLAYLRKRDILASLTELESIGQKIVEIVSARTAVDERYATSLDRIGNAVDVMSE